MGPALSMAAGFQLYTNPRYFEDGTWVGVMHAIGALAVLTMGIYFASGIVRRHEPIVEVSDARVRSGSIYLGTPRVEVETARIAGVSLDSGWLLLTTRSGELVKMALQLLSPEKRDRVRSAIEKRIAKD
jgi:hypothetical protein